MANPFGFYVYNDKVYWFRGWQDVLRWEHAETRWVPVPPEGQRILMSPGEADRITAAELQRRGIPAVAPLA